MKNSEMPSAPVAQVTKDKLIFKKITWNRNVKRFKVENLIKTIKGGVNFLQYYPILLDKDFKIVDGQHRLAACEELGLPVYYHVLPHEAEMNEVMELNSNSSNWVWDDYINMNMEHKLKIVRNSYTYLKDICNKYSVPKATIASLLFHGNANRGKALTEAIKHGQFRVRYDNEVLTFLDNMESLKPVVSAYTGPITQAFWEVKDNEQFSFEKFLHKCTIKGEILKNLDSKKQALSTIEDIYNFASKNRVILFN